MQLIDSVAMQHQCNTEIRDKSIDKKSVSKDTLEKDSLSETSSDDCTQTSLAEECKQKALECCNNEDCDKHTNGYNKS